MRKIGPQPIAVFAILTTIELVASGLTALGLIAPLLPETYRGIGVVLAWVILFYLYAILAFRGVQAIFPVPTGYIEEKSGAEQRAFLYTLYYLMFFNTLIFSPTLPVPLMRLVLQLLGARMGPNAYSSGIVMDPQFVSIGADTIIGNGAMVVPHIIEGHKLGFFPVKIGARVTIGVRAIIMADVEIGDDATVAIHAVVTKGSRIPAGEVWGGIPAKRIGGQSQGRSETPA